METNKGTRKGNAFIKPAMLLLIAAMVAILAADIVLAAPTGMAIGERISGYFDNYASTEGPTFLDFFIFTVIFFAVCWIGFSTAFKEAKNANIALSVAVGLALSVALVYGGKFTLKKLLPFAGTILFIVAIVMIYAFLKKFIFTSDTKMSKFLAFLFAIIIAIALFIIFYHFVCASNNCESNAFMQKVFGSESIFGKLWEKIKSFDLGSGGGPLPPAIDTKCGNGKVEKGEKCDWILQGTKVVPVGECKEGEVCVNNCKQCAKEHFTDSTWGWITKNLVWIALGVIVVILLGLGYWRRHQLMDRVRNRFGRHGRGLRHFRNSLLNAHDSETRIIELFRELCNSVRDEQTTFGRAKHIVDMITTDIKETIGQEIEYVQHTEVAPGGNIDNLVHQLVNFNTVEAGIINGPDGILHHINEQVNDFGAIPQQLEAAINELNNIDQHLQEHADILQTFKQHSFRERNILTRIRQRLDQNRDSFQQVLTACNTMITILNQMIADARAIAGNNDYNDILRQIHDLRNQAIRLNRIFSSKVSIIHYLGTRLQEMQQFIHELHETERSNVADLLLHARNSQRDTPDRAIYYAVHVLENVEALEQIELAPDAPHNLQRMRDDAIAIIDDCGPRLWPNIREEVRNEMREGNYVELWELTRHAARLEYLGRHRGRFEPWLTQYRQRMLLLQDVCERVIAGRPIPENLRRVLRS